MSLTTAAILKSLNFLPSSYACAPKHKVRKRPSSHYTFAEVFTGTSFVASIVTFLK